MVKNLKTKMMFIFKRTSIENMMVMLPLVMMQPISLRDSPILLDRSKYLELR